MDSEAIYKGESKKSVPNECGIALLRTRAGKSECGSSKDNECQYLFRVER